jgi:hypothetical protein
MRETAGFGCGREKEERGGGPAVADELDAEGGEHVDEELRSEDVGERIMLADMRILAVSESSSGRSCASTMLRRKFAAICAGCGWWIRIWAW